MFKPLTTMYSTLLTVFMATFLFAGKAFALSCAPTPIEAQFLSAPVVFSGTVTAIEAEKSQDSETIDKGKQSPVIAMGGVNQERKVTFAIKEAHKGELSETIEVYENTYWGSSFSLGKKFLVFAHRNNGRLNANLCGGIVAYKSMSNELDQIKQVKALVSGQIDHLKGKLPHGNSIHFSIDRREDDILVYQEYVPEGKVIQTREYKVDKIKKASLKTCPEKWYDNQMPTIGDLASKGEKTRQYFILDGQRRELAEFDMNWVTNNCNIKPQVVY